MSRREGGNPLTLKWKFKSEDWVSLQQTRGQLLHHNVQCISLTYEGAFKNSNDDSDGNGKKAIIVLDWQNNNHAFLYIS